MIIQAAVVITKDIITFFKAFLYSRITNTAMIPVMTATGINPTTAGLAFASGASAIGCGSCVNKLDSEISMIAVAKSLVEIAEKNAVKSHALV